MAKAPFIVAFGGESFLLDRELLTARRQKGRTITVLNGNKLSGLDVIAACEEISFDESNRVVIVDDAQKMKKGEKDLLAWAEGRDPGDISTFLVGIVRSEKCPSVWSKIGALGILREYKTLAPWETDQAVERIKKEAKTLRVRLASGVPEMLIQGAGLDLARHVGELRKLAMIARDGTVTKSDVQKVVVASKGAEPYQVAEAAILKDPRKALRLLSLVYRHMGEQAHVPVASALARQVERLAVVRYMVDQGADQDSIASRLGMHPYRLQQTLMMPAKKHTLEGLLGQMRTLCRLDATVKGPARSKRTHVELAVLSIAT